MVFALTNPLKEPLIQLMMWLNGLVAGLGLPDAISSWAVAIILVSVVIKLLTYPLTATQTRSMRATQALQPKLQELQKRYKNDREKLSQAQMELYKEHGVNPFGGCLPLIIQMVVLFGMYSAIRQLSTNGLLDGQRFLWIPNLAKCEPNPLCADVASVLPIPIPILLILLVVSQFAYQKYATPPSADAQAQAMNQSMKLMPIFFAFIFAKLAAGLVLYYAMFNVASVAQQALMVRGAGTSASSPPEASGDGRTEGEETSDAEDVTEREEQKTDERVPRRRRRRKKNR